MKISGDTADPSATPKSKSNIGSLASSGAKFILRGIRDSADAFPPLKSAAGAMCVILDNCEVRLVFDIIPDLGCSFSC